MCLATNDFNNFDYNIEQLTKPINLNISKQPEVMNSEKFNSSLLSIQQGLDSLYEKTRYLEDSIDYARTFLDQKITTYANRINTIISSVSDISNINKNMSYIDYAVPFRVNTVESKDRNKNYTLKPCAINGPDKVLTISDNVNRSYKITSITRSCEQIPYDSNIDSVSDDEKYRVIYIEDKPFPTGATETFTCYLDGVSEVNYVNVKAVNSNAENIILVYPNGVTELVDSMTGVNTETRMCTHLKFNLNCTAYSTVEYVLDEELANADNLWNKINEYEYSLSIDKESKIEVDALIKRTVTGADGKVESKVYRSEPEKVITVTKYLYIFGLDTITIGMIDFNEDCYFLSDSINIGKLGADEYLQIYAVDNAGEHSCIEYFLVDGDIEIPIMPPTDKYVYNERIFPENDLRFPIDDDVFAQGVFKIKKDGLTIDATLEDVIDQYDAIYSASYQPTTDCYKYTPINDTVRVKAVIRVFGSNIDTIPYIKSINIRKYGGATLWTKVY